MLEPVEIPININGNAAEEGKRIQEAVAGIGDSSKYMEKELKKSIALQQQYLAKLKAEIAKIEQTIKESPSAKGQLSKSLNALKRELIDETEGLKHLQAEVKLTSQAKESLRTKIYAVREEMGRMRQAGQENSQVYQQHREELAQLNDAYQAVVKEQQLMTKGSASMTGIVNGLQGLAGAITAVVGSVGLLSGESEQYAKIQTKVQSLLAVTIGLQQVQQTLGATSAFRVHTLTKAKQAYTRVLQRMTVAMGGSTLAAKAMMGALTGGLALLVGWGISALDKYITKQKEAAAVSKALHTATASGAASSVVQFEKLRKQFVSLNGDIKKQSQFVKDNQKAFEDLGVLVTDAHDAENLFIDNAENFVDSLIARAKATAAFELAVEKYREGLTKMMEAEERAKKRTLGDKTKAFFVNGAMAGSGQSNLYSSEVYAQSAAEKIRKEGEKAFAAADELLNKQIGFEKKADDLLEQAGIQRIKKMQSRQEEKDFAKAFARLAKISADAEKESHALILAAMEEGRKKKLAKLKQEHEEKKALIEAQLKEIAELEAKYGIDVTQQRKQLQKLDGQVDNDYQVNVDRVNAASDAIMADIQLEIDERFATQLSQRLTRVDDHYRKLLEKAKEHAKDEQELAEATATIEKARLQEVELVHREHELKQLDIEERIELRRLQMSSKRYALQANQEEEFIRKQIELAEKRLSKLQEIEAAGGDAADDIKMATAEVRELREELEQIPIKKVQELGNAMRSIFSSLSGLGGEVGAIFGEMANGVDNVIASLKKEATTAELVGNAISGLAQLWGMAQRQAEENRKAMDAYTQSLIEAEHRQKMLNLAALDYKASNIFGVENPYARAIAEAKQYSEAMAQLQKSIAQLERGNVKVGTRKVLSGKNIASGAAGGAGAGAAIGSIIPGIGTAIGAAIGGFLGGIFGGTKKKVVPVFRSLASEFGSILKSGTKTFELNPEILANYNKLDDATKKLVDNWEEVRKKALEAEKQMRDTFQKLAGDLGQTLAQSLVSAWRNGDVYAAVDDYAAHVNKTIENIIEQMVFAQHFQALFDELEKKMADSYGAGGDGSIVDDIIWFSKEYKKGIESFGRDMDAAKEELAKQGIKAFEMPDPRRQAEARGIARASQDDITKFNGQMTLVVERINVMMMIMEAEQRYSIERLNLMRAIYNEVSVIARNSQFLRELATIKQEISRLNRDGVKMKR